MLKVCEPDTVECEQLAVVLPDVECAELVALAEAECDAFAEAEGLLDAVGDGDDDGVSVSEDVGAAAAVAVLAADELEALVPHALRPIPPMATAMMTAGTRHFNILDPPLGQQTLQKVTHNNSGVTIGAGGRAARRS